MSRVDVTYPRADTEVRDFLVDELTADDVTVGFDLPPDWTPNGDPHLQVVVDGTPLVQHPVAISSTVRIVAWAAAPTLAHMWAMRAHGIVLAHEGSEFTAFPLTGPLPAVDPDHEDAALCSITVRVRVRSIDNT